MNVLTIGIILAVFFLLLFLFLKSLEKKTIFFQVKGVQVNPDYFGLPFQDIYFSAADKTKLNGWYILNQKRNLNLLFLHGNGGNISHRLHKVSQLHQLGVSVFLIDYRGYGNSQGKPSVAGIYKDAEAALKFLTEDKKVALNNLVLYGESLGTTLAVNLASRYRVGGLILDGAFSCGQDMAKIVFPYLPSFFIPDIFKSSKDITKVKSRKLFIHSCSDEIVPIHLAKKLYQKADRPKEFVELIGGHNTFHLDCPDKYLESIDSFLVQIENKDNGVKKD